MGRLPTLRARLSVILPLAAFVAATTHWMPWAEPIRLKFAGDVDDYERIARAAPHFTWPQIEGHIGMWLSHYLVGILSKGTHLPLHATYYIVAIVFLVWIVYLLDRILGAVGAGPAAYTLAMSAALLNPYVFRYLALAPGIVNDAVFVAGTAVAVLAMLERRRTLVVVGLLMATLARDVSAPPLLLGIAIWLYFDLRRHGESLLARWGVVSAAVLVPLAGGALEYWGGRQTPGNAKAVKGCCSVYDLTIAGDLRRLPGSAGSLALHVGRIGVGIALVLALLVAAWILGRRAANRVRPEAWGMLLVAALMIAQPLLVSANWNQGDEPRLASLALPALVGAAGSLLARLEAGSRKLAVLVLIGCVASLSHRFSWIGPRSASQFAALELACAAAVVWVLVARDMTRGRDPAQA